MGGVDQIFVRLIERPPLAPALGPSQTASEPPIGINRFVGSLDAYMTYSYNVCHLRRVYRKWLSEVVAPDEVACFGHLNRRSQLPKRFPGEGRDCQFWD